MDPINELLRAFGRVEGKLDGLLAQQTKQEMLTTAHDTRIRGLEEWKGKIIGLGLAVGAFTSAATTIIARKLFGM